MVDSAQIFRTREAAVITPRQPLLYVVVDTEEEFDWASPFSRESTGTSAFEDLYRFQEIFDRHGVKPTFVMDYPVATSPLARRVLGEIVAGNRCALGAHLHPWVNPPFVEPVNAVNSYHGNLPVDQEQAKILALRDAIAEGFGAAPTIFKAGRYGLGPNTLGLIREAGFTVDCSVVPWWSFASDGGPNYCALGHQPFWTGPEGDILELPMTAGFLGLAASAGPAFARLLGSDWAGRARLPGLLARSGLLEYSRLSPEGVAASEQLRLIAKLMRAGVRIFSLTLHSPSAGIGHTPYVRDEAERRAFLVSLDRVLRAFRQDFGGSFATIEDVRSLAAASRRVETPVAAAALAS